MTVDVTTTTPPSLSAWTAVCRVDDLSPERGAAALVGGDQVALFRTFDDTVYAVQQLDPYSGAHVMSRGIVGTRGDIPTVASPMYIWVAISRLLRPWASSTSASRSRSVRSSGRDAVAVSGSG